MKNLSWLAVFLVMCQLAFAQTGSLQKEINDQVWKPFIKSFNDRDDDAFKAVHSKDVIRVMQDDAFYPAHCLRWKSFRSRLL
jgi:hypothetical protein